MGRHLTGTLQMAKQDIQSHNMSLPTVTTQLFKPKITVYIYIYIYLTHMVPVISEPDPSHHQNTIHISFKSESYINT
jgi:hypothetical protein